jgi:hypothetical protein
LVRQPDDLGMLDGTRGRGAGSSQPLHALGLRSAQGTNTQIRVHGAPPFWVPYPIAYLLDGSLSRCFTTRRNTCLVSDVADGARVGLGYNPFGRFLPEFRLEQLRVALQITRSKQGCPVKALAVRLLLSDHCGISRFPNLAPTCG